METAQERKAKGFTGIPNKNGQPKKDFIPYEDAKRWVNRLGFENYKQWIRFSKLRYKTGPLRRRLVRPSFIPANPGVSYRLRGEWGGDRDFLGHHEYWPYEEARKFALSLNLQSSYEWKIWHRENNPIHIPRYPSAVYEQWNIWSDFLGSKHVHYTKRESFAPYNEAIKLVHSLRFDEPEEYRLWVKQHSNYNLPVFPEVHYKEWDGWLNFLGKSIVTRIDIAQNIDNSILYIAHHRGTPSNVYEIRVEKQGKIGIDARKAATGFTVEKMYLVNPDEVDVAKRIISMCSSEWWERDHCFVVRNIYELMFQLDVLMYTV